MGFCAQIWTVAEQGGAANSDIMAFLGDWLVKHIQGSDKKYGPFLKKKGLE